MGLEETMPGMLKYIEERIVVDNCLDCTFPKGSSGCVKCYETLDKVYKKAYCGVNIVKWEPWVNWDSVKAPYRMNKI